MSLLTLMINHYKSRKKNITVIRYDKNISLSNNISSNNSLGEKKENSTTENTIVEHFTTPPATPLTSPELEALAMEPDENMPNLTLELNESINENTIGAFCLDESTLNESLKQSVNEIQKYQNQYKNESIKSRDPSPEPDTNQLLYPSAKFIRKSHNNRINV